MDDVATVPDGATAKRAILSGDVEGLRAFYEGHFRPLYSFCYHRVGRDHHAAEEVVQETLLLALERIEHYDPERGDLHTWLAFLSRNVIRRVNEQRRRLEDLARRPAEKSGAGGNGAEDEEGDRAALVDVTLARLPVRYRSVLERKYVRGESVRAIAAAEATTEKAIESLLVRARDAFKDAFLLVKRSAMERCV